jgi:YidC/Oxa1 family membrane protein insertase
VLRITRRYSLDSGSSKDPLKYELLCQQRLTNLGSLPLRLVWEQNAQGDTPSEAGAPSDMRSIVHGYYDLAYNPSRQYVYTNKTFQTRHEFIDHLQPGSPAEPMWPSSKLTVPSELVFLAQLNRYFAVVTHRPINATTGVQPRQLDALFVSTGIEAIGVKPPSGADTRAAVMTLTSRPIDLTPGSAVDLDLSLYAGPRKREEFSKNAYEALGFSNLIKYELGCTWFTFQPIARGLLAFLKFIHYWLHDWAVAIIILVLCVRLILHPITKRSQISMMRMSKQMASIQPEMEKLKEKYKDDQTKLNGEIMRLYREKGVNPAGFLGCLPMFLQMPIWVALYAMLYFAIELRHQPAFYGVFQAISGGKWFFLADLSSPDHFIRFSDHPIMVSIPLLSSFDFSAINILPLMMAVVFYAQQKLTQPAPTNDQQKQQQQIMLISTMLFPVFLYNSPSGLTLYIMSSTLGGIIDSWIVRRHIKREEAAGTLLQTKPAKPVKPGSFMDRLSKMVEAKQREMMNNPRDDKRK